LGAPAHGLARLKMYCERLNKKIINPNPEIKIKKILPLLMLGIQSNLNQFPKNNLEK